MDYTREGFTYVQIGAHGTYSAHNPELNPDIRAHYNTNWKIVVTEPDVSKLEYLRNTMAGMPEVTLLNVGIHSDTTATHYSVDFTPVIEEIGAMTYDLRIGPRYVGNFSSFSELSTERDSILQKFHDVPWITQVASYNYSSVLSPNHLLLFETLADYLVETTPLVTWTPSQLFTNLKISNIDILQICQSGDAYDIIKHFPFTVVNVDHLGFKTSVHMSFAQIAEIDELLRFNGFTRDDSWIVDHAHIGYTKNVH